MKLIARAVLGILIAVPALTAAGPARASVASAYARTPSRQIVADAKTALAGVTSVHVRGAVRSKRVVDHLSISVSRAGECAGTLRENRGRVSVIAGGGGTYLRGNLPFWKENGAGGAAAALAGKWVKTASGNDGGQVCSAGDVFSLYHAGFGHLSRARAAGSIHGIPAVRISARDKQGAFDVYVSAVAPHYVLELTSPREGTVVFSAFDVPVDTTPPPGAVDLSQP